MRANEVRAVQKTDLETSADGELNLRSSVDAELGTVLSWLATCPRGVQESQRKLIASPASRAAYVGNDPPRPGINNRRLGVERRINVMNFCVPQSYREACIAFTLVGEERAARSAVILSFISPAMLLGAIAGWSAFFSDPPEPRGSPTKERAGFQSRRLPIRRRGGGRGRRSRRAGLTCMAHRRASYVDGDQLFELIRAHPCKQHVREWVVAAG